MRIDTPKPKQTRHGYVSYPMSRAALCKKEQMGGAIAWEPQSVEAPKGFPAAGPPDGMLASGGHARFAALDGLKDPKGREWAATPLTAGAIIQWDWWLTAPHKTAKFEYFITKDGWNPDQPLARDQFDLTPAISLEWDGSIPVQAVSHWGRVPSNKHGRHVVYGVWTIADTAMAFYQAIDVTIGPRSGDGGDG